MMEQSNIERYWGIVYTKKRYEKLVKGYLDNAGITAYLPIITKERGRSRKSELPMFPGYIFAAWSQADLALLNGCSYIIHHALYGIYNEDYMQKQLNMVKQLELASQNHQITFAPPVKAAIEHNEVQIKSGILKGCKGYLKNLNGVCSFVINLEFLDAACEVFIDGKQLNFA